VRSGTGGVEHREHTLPAPRRQDDPTNVRISAAAKNARVPAWVSFGFDRPRGDLDHEHQQRGADDDAHCELPGAE